MEGGSSRCRDGGTTCVCHVSSQEVQVRCKETPSVEDDLQHSLQDSIIGGNMRGVKAALEAGADLNWRSEPTSAPIAVAILHNRAGIVKVLLEQGADPDKPVTVEVQYPILGVVERVPGVRSLHIAAMTGKVEIVRLLLNRPHSNPNATDSQGSTPLMRLWSFPRVCVEVVRLLLEAGADPTLATNTGCIPLHIAAHSNDMDAIDMLYAKAPATLNRRNSEGTTPLFVACVAGNEIMVSKLLSLGATEPVLSYQRCTCPLVAAVKHGIDGVVRVLINEEGIQAVGGLGALNNALAAAVYFRQATILRLLLPAEGDQTRLALASCSLQGVPLLHLSAAFSYPAAVNVLLHAGADETARDSDGFVPTGIIGSGRGPEVQIDWETDVAVSRMLQRGPAYRARSWMWPSGEEADARGSGDCGTGADAADAVRSFPPGENLAPIIGVQIMRPKTDRGSSNFFIRNIGRYCAKD